jgi:hypothetical protein
MVMGAVNIEYSRFMQWLASLDAESDVRRIAKIVESDLDALAGTVSAGGQRGKMLASLLRDNLLNTDDQVEHVEHQEAGESLPWTRLEKLTVGPFRGFRWEEQFDLNRPVVLFYGPNGSGKTSLCEALEYALLGDVEEASAKRIGSLSDYFSNIHEADYSPPKLWSEGGHLVHANEEFLRFAIIEKNRIEGFSRLAARAPAQASAMIATLFGLEAFNDFVNNFPNSLDSQLLLDKPKRRLLDSKNAALEEARKKVGKKDEALRKFDEDREKIADDFRAGYSFGQLSELLGLAAPQGRLQELNKLLAEQVPSKSGIRRSELIDLRRLLFGKRRALADCSKELERRAGEVSYRKLYHAILSLGDESNNKCPACDTPLDRADKNPFERASEGLEILQDLAVLEKEKDDLFAECNRLSFKIKQALNTADSYHALNTPSLQNLAGWARSVEQVPIWDLDFDATVWRELLRAILKLEIRDGQIQERLSQQQELIAERDLLENTKEKVTSLDGRRAQYHDQIAEEERVINTFDEENAELIKEVEEEEEQHRLELRIQAAYAAYLESLRNYRDQLPEGLLAELNETTRDLYNQINADDHDSDKLGELTLPLRGGERIKVSFRGSPDTTHDALLVLSEGHLRCLGLAILLAKNIKLGLPVVVFDDAVNAIDHDHRAGIRSTIFGDPRFQAKQILVTSHSNEFIKDIQNQLGPKISKLYVLSHHAGDHQPIVQGGSDRHYLVRAQERLSDGDHRQCLASCRQSLENLTVRIWNALGNKSQELGQLSLGLRSPTSRPELRSLTLELEKSIRRGREQGKLNSEVWKKRHEGLEEIVQIPENTLAWQHLNKGTHDEEDREDFEARIVRKVLSALEKISQTF